MSNIPVIDFVDYQKHGEACEEILVKLGTELTGAFETTGFCYLTNHGIDRHLIDKHFELVRTFVTRSVEEKFRYSVDTRKSFMGWIAQETEQVVPERPAGLRESFNYFPSTDRSNWDPAVNDLIDSSELMVQQCMELARRVLTALSSGLGLETGFLVDAHAKVGQNGNSFTCLKSLYYPPISDDSLIKPNQIRIGEHSDYGSITILFQDDQGGLEVEVPGQGFMPATPIQDTVVVNIGDLMQRWSGDKLIATRHRVSLPEDELKRRSPRQSVAFFMVPDDDVIIKCLDGSSKWEDITTSEYMNCKIGTILGKGHEKSVE